MTTTVLDATATGAADLPPFLVSIDVVGGRISLHGELDSRHVGRLLESVAVLTHSPASSWSIDVDGVGFCDTDGLRGLLAAKRLAADAGRSLALTRSRPWLRQLVLIADLGELLPTDRPAGR